MSRLWITGVILGAVACGRGGAGLEAGDAVDGQSTVSDGGLVGGSDGDRACDSSADCAPMGFCQAQTRQCVSRVVSVAAGTSHTCAVHADGQVRCWGLGAFIGSELPRVTPAVPVHLDEAAKHVVVGIENACALLRDGGIACWGRFAGDLTAPTRVKDDSGVPIQGVNHLVGGSLAYCGITSMGTLCWGNGSQGELAVDTEGIAPLIAVRARPGPQESAAATVAIVVHDGAQTLCGWGNNERALFPGPREVVLTPTCIGDFPDVLALSAGDGHVCALRGGSTLSCWGSNSGGQLGVGDETVAENPLPGRPLQFPSALQSVASGAYHVCVLLDTGRVTCWGSNERGECGVAPSAPRFAPHPIDNDMTFVAIGAGAGSQHTCGIRSDGSVACWGYDHHGQLGSGVVTADEDRFSARPLPVRF